MIDFVTIRNYIRTALQVYLRTKYEGILVIQFNPDAPQPESPYLTMNFTSPFIPEGMQAIEKTAAVPSEDPGFEHDIEYSRYSNDTMSASWNVYSDDIDQAHEIALMAHKFFSFDGLDALKAADVVVVEVTAIQNRDAYVVDSWERRLGFDTVFRVLSEVKRVVPMIETVDVKTKESE